MSGMCQAFPLWSHIMSRSTNISNLTFKIIKQMKKKPDSCIKAPRALVFITNKLAPAAPHPHPALTSVGEAGW